MSKTIYKYPLRIADKITLEMPVVHQKLCVAVQFGEPVLYAIVEMGAELVPTTVLCRGTGHIIDGTEGKYLGTVLLQGDQLVIHMFEGD